MKEIRQRVRVREDGRIEISDPSLVAGAEADVVVRLPDAAGDGFVSEPAPPGAAPPAWHDVPLVDEHGRPVFLPPVPDGTMTLDQIFGLAPSGRTAEEVDRELRTLRDEWDRDLPGR